MKYILYILILIPSYALSHSNSINLYLSPGLSGMSLDPSDDELQGRGYYDYRLEIDHDFDKESSSFNLALGYSILKKGYYLFPNNNIGSQKKASLKLNSLYFKIAHDIKLRKINLTPSIRFGKGEYDFNGESSSVGGFTNVYGIDFIVSFQLKKILLKAGWGYSENQIDDKTIDNVEYKGDNLRKTVHLNLGIGYLF